MGSHSRTSESDKRRHKHSKHKHKHKHRHKRSHGHSHRHKRSRREGEEESAGIVVDERELQTALERLGSDVLEREKLEVCSFSTSLSLSLSWLLPPPSSLILRPSLFALHAKYVIIFYFFFLVHTHTHTVHVHVHVHVQCVCRTVKTQMSVSTVNIKPRPLAPPSQICPSNVFHFPLLTQ